MNNIKLFFINLIISVVLSLLVSCGNANNKGTYKNHSSKDTENVSNTSYKKVKKNIEVVDSSYIHEILGGWLKESLSEKLVVDSIGLPDNKGEDEYWDAIGLFVQHWEYKKIGVFLDMASDKKEEPKKILSITIISPCPYTTSKKIGIGSDVNLIREKYSNLIDENNSNMETIVIGSIYGGTIFTIKKDKVSEIFIGAAAE